MKILNILNGIFLIPSSILVMSSLASFVFRCSMSGATMQASCAVNAVEPLIESLLSVTFLLGMLGFLWFLPGLIIAIITLQYDYNVSKQNNLPMSGLTKKISFYAIIPYILILVMIVFSIVKNILFSMF